MKRHEPDWISLAFGGVFVTLAVVLPIEGWVIGDWSRWVIPAAVLLLGIGIAVSAIATARAQSEQDQSIT